MNLNKRSTYEKFNKYSDLITEEVIVYIYGDSFEKVFNKINTISKFLNKNKIAIKKVYYDISNSKELIDKPDLARIFRDEDNVDIITCTANDICPLATGDYYDIRRYLKENNLGVFDLGYNEFYFERAPLLVWSNYCGV